MADDNFGFQPITQDTQSPQEDYGFEPIQSETSNTATQPPVSQPSLVKEFFNANDKVAGAIRNTFLRGNPKAGYDSGNKVENFADTYPQAVMNVLEKSKFLREHPNVEDAIFQTAGAPAKLGGMVADQATNPLQIAGNIVGGRILKSAMPLAEKAGDAINSVVDFGGKKSLTEFANDAKNSLDAANEAFKKSYNTLFEKVGDKAITSTAKDQLLSKAVDALDQTSPNSPVNSFLTNKFPDMLDDPNLDVKNLHAMKGTIFKQAKSTYGVEKNALMKVYNEINSVLGSDEAAGADYANLTSQQHDFFNNESNYIKRLVLDPVNKNNVITSKIDKFNLPDNYKDALERLSGRPSSTSNLMQHYNAIKLGERIKSVAGKSLLGLAKYGGVAGAEILGLNALKGYFTNKNSPVVNGQS